MKTVLKIIGYIFLTGMPFVSCKKEPVTPPSTNQPAIAKAGADQTITLPKDIIR